MNVIGSRPDGWWKDRKRAIRLLAWELRAYAEETGEELVVVFDGRPIELLHGMGIEIVFAPGGANAADRKIARLVERRDDPSEITVVTSDKALVASVRDSVAGVIGSGEFRQRLDEVVGAEA